MKHATLAEALAAAQLELHDPARSKANKHLRSKYAGLDDVLGAVRPVLAKHGIALSQLMDIMDGRPVMVTRLWWGDGSETNEVRSVYPLTLDDSLFLDKERKITNALQRRGIEIAYARRYSLEAIVGVAATDDSDGATTTREERTEARRAPPAQPGPQADERHPSWDAHRRAFCAALTRYGTSYDVVKAAAEAKGWGKPSTWARTKRVGLLAAFENGSAWRTLDIEAPIPSAEPAPGERLPAETFDSP